MALLIMRNFRAAENRLKALKSMIGPKWEATYLMKWNLPDQLRAQLLMRLQWSRSDHRWRSLERDPAKNRFVRG